MLTIDSREPQQTIWDVIANLDIEMVPFEFACLSRSDGGGDYLIENGGEQLLVTRKTMSDFCGSYVLLKEQMDEMRAKYDWIALVIEGNYICKDGYIWLWRSNKLTSSMKESAFHDFKLSQQMRGSLFDHTNSLDETIRLLIHWHNFLPKAGINPVRKSRKGMEIIASIPGMGPLSTFDVRSKYGSLGEAFDKRDEWIPAKSKSLFGGW